eukprot:25606_1
MLNKQEYIPIYIDEGDENLTEEEFKTSSPEPLADINENEAISDIDLKTELEQESILPTQASLRHLNGKSQLLRKHSTIRIHHAELTTEDCELLEQQVNILLDPQTQMLIYDELIKQFPKLEYAFSMVSGKPAQASFVCKMIRKGYVKVYENNYDQVYNVLMRHPKYGVQKEHMSASLPIVKKYVLKHPSIVRDIDSDKLLPLSTSVWQKSNDILIDIMSKAYKSANGFNSKLRKKPKAKMLKKNRMRITRSMSNEDIECVLTTWKRTIEENKDKVSDLLAVKIQKETEMFQQFYKLNVDVFKQAIIIIEMLDKTINKLENTDLLVPYLKSIGAKHAKMGIKPQMLALMKKIILELVKEVLSFNFDTKIRNAWQRVMTFIVGMMMMEYNNRLKRNNTMSTTESSVSWSGDMFDRPTLASRQNYDSNDVQLLETALSPTVILNCQITWRHINSDIMINNAVTVFYQDLLNSKQEIRALFSKSNMKEQITRLIMAIGSTVALLDDLDTLIPILVELGKRHVYYGVKPSHFKTVKRCWFKMLEEALKLQWNKQINNSWHVAWDFMTYYMKASLEDALLLYVPPEPIIVNFKILINHIDKIKLSDLSFFGDIWYAAYTGDNSSQSYAFGHALGNRKVDDGGGILPFGGVRCLNAMQTMDKYRNLKEPYIRYFDEDDSWYLRGNIVGSFSQMYELQSYPFDVHNIELIFSLQVDDTIAKFNKDRISVRLMPFKLDSMAGTNYNVHIPTIDLVEMSALRGGSSSGRRYTHCKVSIPISRKYIHHIYNIIVPLMAMQLIAFSIYFTDLFPITARLILSMTLFLTLFAFRRAVSGSLPPTPYLTLIDHAFNAACFLSVYHVAGLCIINQLQHFNKILLMYINITIGGIGVFIFLIIHIYLYTRAIYYVSRHPKQIEDIIEKTGNAALAAVARSARSRINLEGSRSMKSVDSNYSYV